MSRSRSVANSRAPVKSSAPAMPHISGTPPAKPNSGAIPANAGVSSAKPASDRLQQGYPKTTAGARELGGPEEERRPIRFWGERLRNPAAPIGHPVGHAIACPTGCPIGAAGFRNLSPQNRIGRRSSSGPPSSLAPAVVFGYPCCNRSEAGFADETPAFAGIAPEFGFAGGVPDMCGIAGALDLTGAREFATDRLLDMTGAIAHRGPDDEHTYQEPGVALGARRLSIVDLAGGRQPLSNEDGSIWVAFNGELFEYPELRRELLARGHQLATRCDTEAWVHLYEDRREGMT